MISFVLRLVYLNSENNIYTSSAKRIRTYGWTLFYIPAPTTNSTRAHVHLLGRLILSISKTNPCRLLYSHLLNPSIPLDFPTFPTSFVEPSDSSTFRKNLSMCPHGHQKHFGHTKGDFGTWRVSSSKASPRRWQYQLVWGTKYLWLNGWKYVHIYIICTIDIFESGTLSNFGACEIELRTLLKIETPWQDRNDTISNYLLGHQVKLLYDFNLPAMILWWLLGTI